MATATHLTYYSMQASGTADSLMSARTLETAVEGLLAALGVRRLDE